MPPLAPFFPASRCAVPDDAKESAICIIARDFRILQLDIAVRIRHVDDVAGSRMECASFHREIRAALFRIPAHGLVNHDSVDIFFGHGAVTHFADRIHVAVERGILEEMLFFPSMTAPSEDVAKRSALPRGYLLSSRWQASRNRPS